MLAPIRLGLHGTRTRSAEFALHKAYMPNNWRRSRQDANGWLRWRAANKDRECAGPELMRPFKRGNSPVCGWGLKKTKLGICWLPSWPAEAENWPWRTRISSDLRRLRFRHSACASSRPKLLFGPPFICLLFGFSFPSATSIPHGKVHADPSLHHPANSNGPPPRVPS